MFDPWEALQGAFGGLAYLLVAVFGYGLFYLGRRLARDSDGTSSPLKRPPKWRSVLVAAAVAAVLEVAATPHAEREGGDYLSDPGEVVDVTEVRTQPNGSSSGSFFSWGAMLVGILDGNGPTRSRGGGS